VESILEQSFQCWELILVDDGNDLEWGYDFLYKDYAQQEERIKIIRQEHSGVSAARNNGLKAAQGKYISFIDSDDFVESDFLQMHYNAIQDSDLSICAVAEQWYPMYAGWVDRRVFWSRPIHYNGLQYINFCHNKLYKKEIISQHQIQFDVAIKLGEDALFLDKYFDYCKSIRCIDPPLYHYVPDEGSAVHRYRANFWEWEKIVIEKQWNKFHQYPLRQWQEQAMLSWLYRKYKYAMYYYLANAKKDEARAQIKAIVAHPLFNMLKQCDLSKKNNHLGKKDKAILAIWNVFKLNGVYFTWRMRGRR